MNKIDLKITLKDVMKTMMALLASLVLIGAIYIPIIWAVNHPPKVTSANGVALHFEPAVTLYIPVTSEMVADWTKAKYARIVLHQLAIRHNTGVRVLLGTEDTKCGPDDVHYVSSVTGYPNDGKPRNYLLDIQPTLDALIKSGKLNIETYSLAVTLVATKLDPNRPAVEKPFQVGTVYIESQ